MVAPNRLQKLVKSMIGVVIAEATLLKFALRLHHALARWESQSTEKILRSPAINVDETSFRVDMKNYWIHVYSSNNLTLKFLTFF
jgi:transposase